MSYLPPNETSADLFLERTNLDGAVAGGVVYGMLVVLVLSCYTHLFSGKPLNRVNWYLVAYVTVMFSLATAYVGLNTRYVEMMFIDDRNYPGGPVAFYEFDTPIPVSSATVVIYAIINFLADALLLYRCFMVWNRRWLVMVLPILTFIASTIISIIAVYQTIRPGAPFFSETIISFTVPWFSLSIALNLLLTLLIAGRLIAARNRLRAVLGAAHARLYTSITAMVVESAALYAASSIVVIANISINNGIANTFINVSLPINAIVMVISPILIISRVARGQAYSKEAVSATSATLGIQAGNTSQVGRSTTAIAMSSWSKNAGASEADVTRSTGSVTKLGTEEV